MRKYIYLSVLVNVCIALRRESGNLVLCAKKKKRDEREDNR
jgi:hypothetical protein